MNKKQPGSDRYAQLNTFSMIVLESKPWIRYVAALVIVIAAAAVRLVFLGGLGSRAPYMTFYPAVMIVALLCGFPSGILATFLSALLATYFWIEPLNQLTIRDQADWLGLIVFMLSCLTVACLSAILRHSERRFMEAKEQLKLLADRTQYDEKLQEMHKLLDDVQHLSKLGGWKYDVEIDEITWTDEVYNIYGVEKEYDPKDVLTDINFYSSEDRPIIALAFEMALLYGEPYDLELTLIRLNGERVWVRTCGNPQLKDGKVVSITGNILDITEQKKAENKLRENQELLQAVINGTHDVIFVKDLNSRILLANPACLRLHGKSHEEVAGRNPFELHFDHEIATSILENDRRIMESGQAEVIEETVQGFGGLHTFLSCKIPRSDAVGRIIGLIGVSHDITARKQTEEKQNATIELLRLCNNAESTLELMRSLTLFFQDITGCEAIGVRLRNENYFPYYQSQGFSQKFVQAESSLCGYDQAGGLICDLNSNPVLDCMCGNILCGNYDPSQPFFTTHGSFWTSCTTELLANITNVDRRARTCNRCNSEGYESVALIPIRFHSEILGLFQFNGKAQGRFTGEIIASMEELVDYVAIALAKLRSDDALRESERRYSALFSNKISGMAHCRVITDEQGLPVDYVIMRINEAYERLIGIKKADIEGRKVTEVFPGVENYSFDYIGILGKIALEGGETMSEAFLEPTQQYLSICAYSPLPGEFTVMMTDVTERKQQEETIRKNEFEFRMLAESMPQIVWIARPDGRNIYFNQQWVEYTGQILEESYGHGWVKPFHPDDQQMAWDAWQNATKNGVPYALECRLLRADGVYKWWLIRGVPVLDEQGAVLKWFGTCTDIDEIKQSEGNLHNYACRLIQMEEELRKKLAEELHDEIGRDLTVLGMNLAIISNNLTDEATKYVGTRAQESVRLLEGISRTVRGIMVGLRPPVLEDFGLLATLRWHVDLFFKRTGIQVTLQAGDSFPRLAVDKEMALFRITQEALMNTAKHAATQNVTIKLRSADAMIYLTVVDEGKGFIPPSSSLLQETSGWGIKIMRERAELIGGNFRFDSAPGIGTTVSVELPLEDV